MITNYFDMIIRLGNWVEELNVLLKGILSSDTLVVFTPLHFSQTFNEERRIN